MTDHLPECVELNAFDSQYGYTTSCKCERLRVYAAKVRMEDDDYAYVAAQAEADGRRRGWDEALYAAREAVAGLPLYMPDYNATMFNWDVDVPQDEQSWLDRDAALAAIDALRGEA